MNCINCGKELKEGAKFCPGCGTPCTADADSGSQQHSPYTEETVAVKSDAANYDPAIPEGYHQPAIPESNEYKPQKKSNVTTIIITVLVILIIAAATFFSLIAFEVIDNPFAGDSYAENTDKMISGKTPYEEEIVETVPESDVHGLTFGKVTDNIYENPSIGIGCALTADWTFYTDQEISEMTGKLYDRLSDDVSEIIANSDIIYDMYAHRSNNLETINVVIEKGKISELYSSMEEFYNSNIPIFEYGLESMGMTDIESKVTNINIDQTAFKALTLKATYYGVPFYETLVTLESGDYSVSITCASYYEDNAESFFDYFYFK